MTTPRQPRPSDRVAILGAGPAGLTMAEELRLAGYGAVTILEARGRVGGKVYSPVIDGIACEAGAVWRVDSPIYRRYAEHLGLEWRRAPRRPPVRFVDAARGGRRSRPLLRTTTIGPIGQIAQLARYIASVEAMRRDDAPGFGGEFLRRPDFQCTMADWFHARGLAHVYHTLGSVLVNALTGRPGADIPFPYFLKLLLLLQRYDLGTQLSLALPHFREGNDALWRALAAHHDIRHSATVRHIERGRPIRIHTSEGLHEVDAVVWTGQLDALARLITPALEASDPLVRAAARVRTLSRVVTTCRVEDLPTRLFLQVQGHEHRPVNYPVSVYEVAAGAGLYNFYSFMRFPDHEGDPLTMDDVTRGIEAMVSDLGGHLRAVEAAHVWEKWFPHFGLDDYRSGILLDLERLQGRDGVFFSCEALAGITVPAAMEYAASLRERFFPAA